MEKINRKDRWSWGFAAMEIIAVVGVVALIAALMTPSILNRMRETKVSEAYDDVTLIATALASFYEDMGRWPTDDDADHSLADQEVRLLWTERGVAPEALDGGTTWPTLEPKDTFENQLITNEPASRPRNAYPTSGDDRWDGPYAREFPADPWNHKYLCNVGGFHPGAEGPVWVLSAGPDGVIQTAASARRLTGDDIGHLLKR